MSNKKSTYIHGTTPKEQRRLGSLNRIINWHFLNFLELKGNEKVLEAGSGLGILTREVARRLPKGNIFGIEISKAQLAAARKQRVPNLHFKQGDVCQIPFENNFFDALYCRCLLEHVRDPLRALREMRRVLKQGGKIFIQENNILINELDPDCPRFDDLWKKFIQLQTILGGDGRIGKRLFSLLRAAGFKNVEISLQPEIHHFGDPTFPAWIENLKNNIRGTAHLLQKHHLANPSQIEKALQEISSLSRRKDASAIFYWNRAKAKK